MGQGREDVETLIEQLGLPMVRGSAPRAGALREVSLQAGPRSHLFQQVNLFFIYHF